MSDGTVVLKGDLGFISLGDLLQLIGTNGSTGTLAIHCKYVSKPGFIHFKNGNIIHAQSPNQEGIEAAYELFGWRAGEFEFNMNPPAVERTIQAGRMEIILDGLRMVDEGRVETLGPVSHRRDEAGGLPVVKGPVVDYMVDYLYVLDEEEYSRGQTIVEENKHGSWIWVILQGTVDIVKQTSKGPLTVLKLGEGSIIGTVASFLYQEYARSFSTIAASDRVQLGVLDSPRLTKEYANTSIEFRQFVFSLDKRRNAVTDRAVEFYLGQDQMKAFAANKKPIIRQGKSYDKLFRIDAGEAAIVRKAANGFVPLVRLGPGDFFGSVPFFDINHEPHGAAVLASEEMAVSRLDGQGLEAEYMNLPGTLKNMIENIATCVTITTRVACDFRDRYLRKKKRGK